MIMKDEVLLGPDSSRLFRRLSIDGASLDAHFHSLAMMHGIFVSRLRNIHSPCVTVQIC